MMQRRDGEARDRAAKAGIGLEVPALPERTVEHPDVDGRRKRGGERRADMFERDDQKARLSARLIAIEIIANRIGVLVSERA